MGKGFHDAPAEIATGCVLNKKMPSFATAPLGRGSLPNVLGPGWFLRIALFLAGLFFVTVATVSTVVTFWG